MLIPSNFISPPPLRVPGDGFQAQRLWWILPDPGLVFLLEGALDDAGLVSPRKGARDLDPLRSVRAQEFPVPCGGWSGVNPEAPEWSKLLMESGIPPFFGKAGGKH